MKYKISGKELVIPDEEIKNFEKKYSVSESEAVQLWLEDNDFLDNEEVEEMTKKAKQTRHYEKSDKERKKTTRERKVDETKKKIINGFRVYLEGSGATVEPLTTEAEMKFTYEGESYTVKLIKHRPPKS